MRSIYKTEEQLTSELVGLRQRVAELEASETERKRAEEALQVEKNKLQSVIDALAYGLTIQDRDYNILYQSGQLKKYFGDYLGEKCYRGYEGKDTICDDCPVEKAFRDGKSHSVEKKGKTPSGEAFFSERTASLVRDAEGKIVSCLEVTRDITERKLAEEALQESEEKYRELAESITDIFFAFDKDLRYTYWNKASEELTGISAEDALGKHLYDLFPDNEMTKKAEKVYLKALETKKPQYFINDYSIGGKNYCFEINAYPSKSGLSVFVKDITERKRAEEKRQTILKTALDGFWLISLEGKFLEVNDSCCKMLGYTREEILKMFIWDIEAIESPEEVAQHIKKVVTQGYDRFETRHKRKDGKIIDVEMSINYLDVGGGQFFAFARDITERKQAEEALQVEKNKLQSIIDAIEHGLSIQDKDYNILYQSEPSRMTGGYHLGEKCYRVYEGKDKVCHGCPVEKAFEDGKAHTSERRIVTSSGKVAFLENTASPIRDAEGRIVSCLEVTRDITERKRAEEALRESEGKFRTIFENVSEVIIRVDRYGKILDVNGRAEECFGYKPDEVIGKNFAKTGVLSLKDLPKMVKLFSETIRGKRAPLMVELEAKRKDGSSVLIEVDSELVKKDGKAEGFVAIVRDVTERKRAEEAVRESEEKLRKMFESVTDGISVIDLNGVITEVNQRTVEMHGFSSRDEVVGRSALELIAPCDHEMVKTNMRKALKRGTIKVVEYTLLKADGSEFPGELSTSVLRDAAGNWVGHITISRDITERKRAEEREKRLREELYLSRRLASVGELAAGVAHEMNNPLTGILGFSQRLLRKSADDKAKESLELIHNEAQRAAKVVKNLLTFARRREPKKEYADINDILQKTLDLRAYELKTGNIEVTLDLAANLPQIMVDFYQIQEVFLNTILNAEQAMIEAHGGGNLTIKTEEIEDYVRISFTDDGPGIPAVNLDRLFDPFFTTRGERGGTGLGLSLCHGIVAEHGGRIYARSEAGEGATFFVQLPLTLQLPLTTEKIDESKVAEEQLV